MAADATKSALVFDPTRFRTFRFLDRELGPDGRVTLRYGLDDQLQFVEEFELPLEGGLDARAIERLDGLLALLHWVAGVSYFKTAAPPEVSCETGAPPAATATLLEALYSEGLGEFAYVNGLPGPPRPTFPRAERAGGTSGPPARSLERLLVPVGGGKDSVVAIEIARRSGRELGLFSIGDAPAIARTAAAAKLPHLVVRRRLDPQLGELNRAGALNGHVPVTAIVSCVAALTAALRGFDAVAMANERSASSPNLSWGGIEVNHQFSKSLRAERLLRAAVAEASGAVEIFSIVRPASELAIARAFARMDAYHPAFTSCNAAFRLDPAARAESWCGDCPKCRFVFLALAPFTEPARLQEIFGRDLLADDSQLPGFAELMASGAHKPFECVGEEEESLAAARMLAADPRWSSHSVVARLAAEVVARFPPEAGDPARALALADDHEVPAALMPDVRAVLGA